MVDYRTKQGHLSAATLKALQWYALEHQLKFTATSPFPTVVFKNVQGEEVSADVNDVVKAYEDYRKRTHGRKRAA